MPLDGISRFWIEAFGRDGEDTSRHHVTLPIADKAGAGIFSERLGCHPAGLVLVGQAVVTFAPGCLLSATEKMRARNVVVPSLGAAEAADAGR